MKPLCTLLVALVVLAAGTSLSLAQETLTYVDLVKRMLDLERLATLPAPGETCKQWSSYDRHSQYDAATGKYVAWDANGDGEGFIRKEGDQMVLAEMQGPGCLWRIWSAKAEEGHVKIYLDGNDRPAVDLPFRQYFSGDTAPFNYPALSYDLGKAQCAGQNLYYPIPYQKSCKIVADPGWGAYYHFDYVSYPRGTKLPTFTTQLSPEEIAALKRVNDCYAKGLGFDPAGHRPGEKWVRDVVRLRPGKTIRVEVPGPRAITTLRTLVDYDEDERFWPSLRQVLLKITWDDQPQPAVCCPVGDFFGTAPGASEYRSLATGITSDGGYSFWYMPFAKKAVIEFVNQSAWPQSILYEVVHAPLVKPMDELAYFHSKWHRDTQELPADRWPDWRMLETQGRGRFLGAMLHLWNPAGGWWGEGDEKFFVDGEKFPSTFGTGSEDYFGYAWGHPGKFQRPFHGQTVSENNQGHQSLYRWHILDAVPFQQSFEATIEKYFRTEEKGTKYACLVNWYLAAGGNDPYGEVPVKDRWGYFDKVAIRAGGFEVLDKTGGSVETQSMAGFGAGKWSHDDQLWWTGAQVGQKLLLKVTAPQAGPQEVRVVLTKAKDYGIVQFTLDGKKIGAPVDLYNPEVIRSAPISLGVHELSAGEHQLGVEITGANPAAVPAYMFGLDEVLFEPK